ILSCYVDLLDLHSFPTRRSSDLVRGPGKDLERWFRREDHIEGRDTVSLVRSQQHVGPGLSRHQCALRKWQFENLLQSAEQPGRRSEEHTSELQSQSNLVCRLLLE